MTHEIRNEKIFLYLLESYKEGISFMSDYADRFTTRFNILITLNIGIASVYVSILNSGKLHKDAFIILPILGFLISLFSYIQSAQDKYILDKQIQRVNSIKTEIEKIVDYSSPNTLFSALDKTDTKEVIFVFNNIFSWRTNFISMTRNPAQISLMTILVWIVVLFWR